MAEPRRADVPGPARPEPPGAARPGDVSGARTTATFDADLHRLRRELEALGVFRPRPAPVLRSFVVGAALGLGGLAACMIEDLGLPLRALAFVVSTIGFVAMATIGHTAAHGAVAERRWANQLLLHVAYSFGLMLSVRYWRHSHVQVHHSAANVVGVDPDCDLRPVFALNAVHHAELRTPAWRVRLQPFLLLLVLPLNGFNIQRQGWQRLLFELSSRDHRRAEAWIDLAGMLAHVGVFVLLPMLWLGPLAALALYALRVTAIGIALFAILAPGHFPVEAACLAPADGERAHFWLRTTVATLDFRTGRLGRWLVSGLDCQIEHHLFPRISHVHLREVQRHVRALCERHGLPHRTLGWGEAVWKSAAAFATVKPVLADDELARGAAVAVPAANGPR